MGILVNIKAAGIPIEQKIWITQPLASLQKSNSDFKILKIFQFIYKIGYASKRQSCWNTILTTTLANLNVVKGFVVQVQASLFSPVIQRCIS
jgi:hypothetical protein